MLWEGFLVGDCTAVSTLSTSPTDPFLLEFAGPIELLEGDENEECIALPVSSNFLGRSFTENPCFTLSLFATLELNLDMMPGSAGLIAVHRTYRIKTRSTCNATRGIKKTTSVIKVTLSLTHVNS
jgi:hypothetical protein